LNLRYSARQVMAMVVTPNIGITPKAAAAAMLIANSFGVRP
jgi:hypothetical protein